MSEIEHLVMPALRAAGRPTTYENQERMRKALTEAAHARAEAVGVLSEIEIANAMEDAAKAAFVQAQSVYRADHDHFPLKHTWETTLEGVREGWRKIAHAAVEAAITPPVGTQPEPRMPRILSALAHPAVPEGWQPIETAPKDGRLILVATEGRKVGSPAWAGMYCAYWSNTEHLWLFHRSGYVPDPTHWMPLPKPPVAAAEKEARG